MDNDKKNISEKITLSAQSKLSKLSKKMEERPPKTQIGKRIALTKLNFLENTINKRIDRESVKNMCNAQKNNIYAKYDSIDISLANQISDLDYRANQIAKELRSLDKFDPNLMFENDNKRKNKYMPKGYEPKPKESSPIDFGETTEVGKRKEELLKKLEEIEKIQEQLREEKEKNLESLENEMEAIENDKDNYLSEIKSPNVFKKIGKFFKEKYAQYKEKKQARKDKIDEKFGETVTNASKTSERETWKLDMPLEEQRKISEEIQERIEKNKQEKTEEKETKAK